MCVYVCMRFCQRLEPIVSGSSKHDPLPYGLREDAVSVSICSSSETVDCLGGAHVIGPLTMLFSFLVIFVSVKWLPFLLV